MALYSPFKGANETVRFPLAGFGRTLGGIDRERCSGQFRIVKSHPTKNIMCHYVFTVFLCWCYRCATKGCIKGI